MECFARSKGAFLVLVFCLLIPSGASATHFSSIASGRILLDVEQNGEAWYVYPPTLERYYLGKPQDAFDVMRELSLGITNQDLEKIPVAGSGDVGDPVLQNRLSGLILLQVEESGEAWYVYPPTQERYYLGRPADAFDVMRNLGLGITSENLAHIPIAGDSLEPMNGDDHSYQEFTLTNKDGSFPVRVVTLSKNVFEMITDTAEAADCHSDCAALPLDDYVEEHDGFAAIHGTYFCPPDYEFCEDKINTFLPPVFNTGLDKMINEDGLKHHDRPVIAQATDHSLYYFHRPEEFGDSVEEFEDTYGVDLRSAIGNWPSLVENGTLVVAEEPMEPGFLTKATRGGIGWDQDFFYLVIAQNATMVEFAGIFDSFGVDYAMNLDGGGTAALYYDGTYRFGPGRELPNAVIFRTK